MSGRFGRVARGLGCDGFLIRCRFVGVSFGKAWLILTVAGCCWFTGFICCCTRAWFICGGWLGRAGVWFGGGGTGLAGVGFAGVGFDSDYRFILVGFGNGCVGTWFAARAWFAGFFGFCQDWRWFQSQGLTKRQIIRF